MKITRMCILRARENIGYTWGRVYGLFISYPIFKKLSICYDIHLFVIWLVGVMGCKVTKTKVARSFAKITVREARLEVITMEKDVWVCSHAIIKQLSLILLKFKKKKNKNNKIMYINSLEKFVEHFVDDLFWSSPI